MQEVKQMINPAKRVPVRAEEGETGGGEGLRGMHHNERKRKC